MQITEQGPSTVQYTRNEAADLILPELGALAPIIAARAAEAEAARRIPADILQMLKSAGVFRMAVPRIHGGLELDLPTIARVVQALVKIDGSIGWIGSLNQVAALVLPLLAQETYERVYQNGPDLLCAGVNQPTGTAVAEADGWRVNGRWSFASGCEDADWIAGACVLTKDGQPLPGPAAGVPAVRLVCLPAHHWHIEDTWRASGLRATGSHHIALRDAFVPSENLIDIASPRPCLPGPLYRTPLHFITLLHGPIALGLAEGALDDIVGMAQSGRQQLRAAVAMRDSEIFQYELGRAQAEFRAAQAMFDAQAASYWRRALGGTLDSDAMLVEGTQTVTWVTEACLRVAHTCFALGGGSAVFESLPLQRRLRDIQVAAQHVEVQARHHAKAGKLLLSPASGPAVPIRTN